MSRWMTLENFTAPGILCFRREIVCEKAENIHFDYAADESCQLFLDGQVVADPPETGAPGYWSKAHCSLSLTPGKHMLTARVLCFGKSLAPHFQTSIKHGFYTSLEGAWEVQQLRGIDFSAPWPDWGVAPRVRVGTAYHDEVLSGKGDHWRTVSTFEDDRVLHAPELPPQRREKITAFHHEGNRIVFDHYVCAWSFFRFTGHGQVSVRWSETAYLTGVFNHHNLKGEKGRRDGAYLVGDPDLFEVSGSLDWFDFQWRAGRIVEVVCSPGVRLEAFEFIRTGYPYPAFAGEGKYAKVLDMAYRTLECCSHTTFMDCPYYERMMYIGDARIESRIIYALGADPALARKSLKLLALSQQPDGMILARYPAKIDQEIPSFVPIYLLMLHDYATWTRDLETTLQVLPAAGRIAELFERCLGQDGLVRLPGWGFVDWVWPYRGIPFGTDEGGANSILNLLIALAMAKLAEVARFAGNQADASRYEDFANRLRERVYELYFNEERGLIADDLKQQFYSEHAQALALLGGRDERLLAGLERGGRLTRCGIYFSSYYLEACRMHGAEKLYRARFDEYLQLCDLGLSTLPEEFTGPRSDCHAWSSHILYFHLMEQREMIPKLHGHGL